MGKGWGGQARPLDEDGRWPCARLVWVRRLSGARPQSLGTLGGDLGESPSCLLASELTLDLSARHHQPQKTEKPPSGSPCGQIFTEATVFSEPPHWTPSDSAHPPLNLNPQAVSHRT
ncbi:unnamed protein product [Rangifer tarandus platyrhynchus]|uniref:Uncharacterized protein n=2 Tax=Rangifer tarandus platyrhynchus TaxID=3082113 RepID=A0ABN8YEJ3_RANTA|nr:unnamed protein product [Rangifer tarandus platyrhynchus]